MEDRANILREMKICRFCLCNQESMLSNIYERQRAESKFSVPLQLQIMACSAIEVCKSTKILTNVFIFEEVCFSFYGVAVSYFLRFIASCF